jgi:O-methyltransferase domain
MTSYSKLLLAEEVLPPGDQPSYGKLSDLNMLISPGGQERTEAGYRALYAAAGFTPTRVIPTRSRIALSRVPPSNSIDGKRRKWKVKSGSCELSGLTICFQTDADFARLSIVLGLNGHERRAANLRLKSTDCRKKKLSC